ncbi:MAG: hypothetical protein C4581_13340 [Nitrospiraceae bacterium]|nr:MAG: hypothetical protein C4581_13340 [Nitrospiraceae bacterium]
MQGLAARTGITIELSPKTVWKDLMEKDDEGNLVLPDISDSSGDMADIISQIESQLKAKGNADYK